MQPGSACICASPDQAMRWRTAMTSPVNSGVSKFDTLAATFVATERERSGDYRSRSDWHRTLDAWRTERLQALNSPGGIQE